MIQGMGCGVPPPAGESDPAWSARTVAALHPAWHYDWRMEQAGTPGYVPLCWRMDAEDVTRAVGVAQRQAASIPLFLLGNEPEIAEQSDTPAHLAAAACREWVRRVGTWAIPYACPGVNLSVHTFDQGRGWLDGYLAAKGPLPTAFHIHIYGNADAWRESVKKFHAWMRLRRVERPVIVSEAGCADDPAGLLAAIRASLDSGEVQAAAWFSARYAPWPALDLLHDDGTLTALGRLFVGAVTAADAPRVVHLPLVAR